MIKELALAKCCDKALLEVSAVMTAIFNREWHLRARHANELIHRIVEQITNRKHFAIRMLDELVAKTGSIFC